MEALFRKILCPLDFDQNFAHALDVAQKIAAQNDAILYVLHVGSLDLGRGWDEGGRVQLEKVARERLEGKVRYEFVVRRGDVVSEVLSAEREFDADLVIIPSHSGRLKRFVLGSVAERVVRESRLPVLVLRLS